MTRKKRKPRRDPQDQPPPADAGPQAQPAPQGSKEGGDPADSLAELQAERDDLLARLERVSADYHNYQKRARRDVGHAQEYAIEALMKALLSILDDMERALDAGRANHDADDPLLTGMQLVHDNALATLAKFGLFPIDAVGKPFDPDQHAAMMQQPTDDQPPQTVLTEVQKGYRLKGRTLRPSGVVVASPAQPVPEEPDKE